MALQWIARIEIAGATPQPINRQVTGTGDEVRDAVFSRLSTRAAAFDAASPDPDVTIDSGLQTANKRGGRLVRTLTYQKMPASIDRDAGEPVTRSEYVVAWLTAAANAMRAA